MSDIKYNNFKLHKMYSKYQSKIQKTNNKYNGTNCYLLE